MEETGVMIRFTLFHGNLKSTMMGLTSCLLLSMVVAAAMGVKEDTKHGKQPQNVDGHHNIHFDHEAILGSYKLEEEFDDLPPEEAKKRLGLLVKKMDKDHDGYVSKSELKEWIIMSFKLLDTEEALEEMEEKDDDKDEKISWVEYVKTHFNYSPEDIAEMRQNDRTDISDFLKGVDEEERKFNAADVNKDGFLDKEEFVAFYHPYNYEHMHNVELDRTMSEHDKNNDGFLSLEEYMGEGTHDKEWEIVEKERFAEFDLNKDNVLNHDEIKPWVLSENQDEAEEEAEHLIRRADTNEDGDLSEREIIESHEEFVGSQATDYGRHLHFVKHKDEL